MRRALRNFGALTGAQLAARVLNFVLLAALARTLGSEGAGGYATAISVALVFLLLSDAGLDARVAVDSAGLDGWHAGDPPDPRAIESARLRGYDLSAQRARQFGPADFDDFALIVGMDRGHVGQLRARRPQGAAGEVGGAAGEFGGAAGEVRLFLEFLAADDPDFGDDVPDPYYGGMTDYELSLDLIERGLPGLIETLMRDFL